MTIRRIRVENKIKQSLLVLFCTVFFKPLAVNTMTQFATLDRIWDILRIATCLLIIWKYLGRKPSKIIILVIFSQIVFMISTIIHSGDVFGFFIQMSSIIGFCMLIEKETNMDTLMFCKALFISLSILTLIHLVLFIRYPSGLRYDTVYYNDVYFLSSKNGQSKFFIPLIVSGLTGIKIEPKKKFKKAVYCMVFVCLGLSVVTQSTTTVIGILVMLLIYNIDSLKVFGIKTNYKKTIILALIMGFVLSVIAVNGGLNGIVSFIYSAQKTENFYKRLIIWKGSIDLLLKSPFYGYGMPVHGGYININGKYMNSHNGYLEILLYGGLIGFGIFIRLITLVMRQYNAIQKKNMSSAPLCGLIAFCIMMISESHVSSIAFWGMFVMINSLQMIETKKIKQG